MNKYFATVFNPKFQAEFRDKDKVNNENVGMQIETTTANTKAQLRKLNASSFKSDYSRSLTSKNLWHV